MTVPLKISTKRIILTGFMGSGKSTVGRLLAQQLGWTFVDLDTAIEERTGQTVPAIFSGHGEHYFRAEESAALMPLLLASKMVIALGGGAPETPENREALRAASETVVVYLEAPFNRLHERCLDQAKQPGATPRPLLADHDVALERFSKRQPHYENIATLRLDTTYLSPPDAADAIMHHLRTLRTPLRPHAASQP